VSHHAFAFSFHDLFPYKVIANRLLTTQTMRRPSLAERHYVGRFPPVMKAKNLQKTELGEADSRPVFRANRNQSNRHDAVQIAVAAALRGRGVGWTFASY
jgi:hypothetical protein